MDRDPRSRRRSRNRASSSPRLLLVAATLLTVLTAFRVFSAVTSPSSSALQSSGPRVAVAVSVTDGSEHRYADLMAALAESVLQWSARSRFSVSLVALVRPGASELLVAKVRAFGFDVRFLEPPVSVEDIRPGEYKNRVDRGGCCGLAELMKIYSFAMEEFYRVVHVDADVMITGNLDEILGAADDVELMYTNSTLPGELCSGGFLVVRPNLRAFNEILDVIRSGDYHYNGKGWEGSGIGYYWGGETVQGVLPFYYLKKLPELHGIHNASKRLDRCIYNNQGSDLCKDTNVEQIKVMHMTLCQKPFLCRKMKQKPICAAMQDNWWRFTNELLKRKGFPQITRCDAGSRDPSVPRSYTPIKISPV